MALDYITSDPQPLKGGGMSAGVTAPSSGPGFFQSLLPTAAAGVTLYDQYNQLGETKDDAQNTLNTVQGQVEQNTQFQPYGITGSMGQTQATADGMNMTMGETATGIQNQMFGLGQSELLGSTGGIQGRQDEVYRRMQQSMAPEQQRAQMMMQQ